MQKMPNPYNVRLIRVGDVQRRRKNKEDDAANLKIAPFPMLLATTHLNAINQPNKSYLQRPHLCASPSPPLSLSLNTLFYNWIILHKVFPADTARPGTSTTA
jgi:hypothetical protein